MAAPLHGQSIEAPYLIFFVSSSVGSTRKNEDVRTLVRENNISIPHNRKEPDHRPRPPGTQPPPHRPLRVHEAVVGVESRRINKLSHFCEID